MSKEESLAFATIEELAALLAKRKISPVELTEMFLRRIERQNPALNAFLTVTAEQALAAARRAEKQLLHRPQFASRKISSPRNSNRAQGQHLDARHPHHGGIENPARFRSRRMTPPSRENWPAPAPFCSAKRI